MITTTLNRIRAHGPCTEGWQKLLAGLRKKAPDDEPLPFTRIVAITGLDDALWCCRAERQYDREWRLYAVWCARQVQHLMTDPRGLVALDVAERYANGLVTDNKLAEAWAAADAAARAAAWAAARAASRAAAGAAVAAAVEAAVKAAAAAEAAAGAAWFAASRASACAVVRAAQTVEFLRVVTETEGRS